ncbi:MAG: ankyrin repeat domain-containing protein, partial [Verrucomicrobiota bacterium]
CDTADLAYMKLLYKNGADPKVKNINGSTTLMYAAGLDSHAPEEEAGTPPECLEAAKFLVNLGLDVNAIDDNGETAMHGAAYKNAPQVVKYLHEQGANIEIWTQLNKRGWSPLFIAEGYRPGNFKPDFATIDAIHEVMLASNLSIPTGPRPKHVNYAP